MNEKLVARMAELLNVKADVPDDQVGSVIDSLNDVHVFKTDELETLKRNQMEKAIEILSDPKQQLPQAIYKRVQGTVLEATENRLKKKFGFNGDHAGIDDLVDKIINEKSASTDSEISGKYDKLKETFKQLEKEKAEEIEAANSRVNKYIINDRLQQALLKLPLAYNDDELPSARKTYANDFLAGHDVKLENDKIIVISKETGKPLVNRLDEPMDLLEVLKAAKPAVIKFKDEPTGGRGDDTKKPAGVNGISSIKDKKTYIEYLEKMEIKPGSKEALSVVSEVIKINPGVNLTK